MRDLVDVLNEINNEIDYRNEEDLVGSGIFSSIDILNVINALEDEYDIDIPPTEIVVDNFRSLEAIEALVKRLS